MTKIKPTDYWRTPIELFESLNAEFDFVADMASTDENALVPLHYTEESDSLSFDWAEEINQFFPSVRSWVWCNPPYSNPKPWVEKALESQRNGLGVVLLLNADTSTEWFLKALSGVSEIRNITGYTQGGSWKNGRIQFIQSEKLRASSNNKAQTILVFDPFKIGANVTTYVAKNKLMAKKIRLDRTAG